MIKNAMLVEQRGQSVGHRRTLQARQIRVVRVQPDRNLTFPVTEDHCPFVIAPAASRSGADTQKFGSASGRPVNGCRVSGSRRMSRIGVNMIEPPRDKTAAGVLNRGR